MLIGRKKEKELLAKLLYEEESSFQKPRRFAQSHYP